MEGNTIDERNNRINELKSLLESVKEAQLKIIKSMPEEPFKEALRSVKKGGGLKYFIMNWSNRHNENVDEWSISKEDEVGLDVWEDRTRSIEEPDIYTYQNLNDHFDYDLRYLNDLQLYGFYHEPREIKFKADPTELRDAYKKLEEFFNKNYKYWEIMCHYEDSMRITLDLSKKSIRFIIVAKDYYGICQETDEDKLMEEKELLKEELCILKEDFENLGIELTKDALLHYCFMIPIQQVVSNFSNEIKIHSRGNTNMNKTIIERYNDRVNRLKVLLDNVVKAQLDITKNIPDNFFDIISRADYPVYDIDIKYLENGKWFIEYRKIEFTADPTQLKIASNNLNEFINENYNGLEINKGLNFWIEFDNPQSIFRVEANESLSFEKFSRISYELERDLNSIGIKTNIDFDSESKVRLWNFNVPINN